MEACEYCGFKTKYHPCTVRDQMKLQIMLEKMDRKYNQKLDREPMNVEELRQRADNRRNMAKIAKTKGLEINPDYDSPEYEEE